jgi:hypothetical protein
MKTYITNIFSKLKGYSDKLDDISMLTDPHWILLNESDLKKTVYIFRPNQELLISTDGKVDKAKWEYLGNDSILVDILDQSYLFKKSFLDSDLLALQVDGKDEYAIFINERASNALTIELEEITNRLEEKYLYGDKYRKDNTVRIDLDAVEDVVHQRDGFTPNTDEFRAFIVKLKNGNQAYIYQKKSDDTYFLYEGNKIVTFSSKTSCLESLLGSL